jgi:hypothetical protein
LQTAESSKTKDVDEANGSNWVTQMLPDTSCVNGMCMCLASKYPKNYDEVGQIHSLQIRKRIETSKTLAIASEVGLGETQLENSDRGCEQKA